MSSASGSAGFECPSCPKTFDTEAGVKQHHFATHGESIAGVDISCEWCGDVKTKRPSKVNEEGPDFCGTDCRDKWVSENHTNKVPYSCDYCGSEFDIHPFRLEQSDMHFCPGSNCYWDWQSENRVGEDAPCWNGGEVTVECASCGEEKQVRKYRAESTERFFCSAECDSDWKAENLVGENSPAWEGGAASHYYGSSWPRQRQKARDRDQHRCQRCRSTSAEIGQEPDVHHISPFREFGLENHEKANELSNLICLCRSCHMTLEGVPLHPQPVTGD